MLFFILFKQESYCLYVQFITKLPVAKSEFLVFRILISAVHVIHNLTIYVL